jgi:hypothetical protein
VLLVAPPLDVRRPIQILVLQAGLGVAAYAIIAGKDYLFKKATGEWIF